MISMFVFQHLSSKSRDLEKKMAVIKAKLRVGLFIFKFLCMFLNVNDQKLFISVGNTSDLRSFEDSMTGILMNPHFAYFECKNAERMMLKEGLISI